jgi:hypothetical protein
MSPSSSCSALMLLLVACSGAPTTNEQIIRDSIDPTTNHLASEAETRVTYATPEISSDTSQLNTEYDHVRDNILKDEDAYYQVFITTSQYEGRSDVTWYFNAAYEPCYFNESWSYEGRDGSTEYLIENNDVVCAWIEENNVTEKWCSTTDGITTTWDEETGEAVIVLLPATFASTLHDALARYLDTLKSILAEAEIIEEDEGSYTLRSESSVDVGMEVTEYVEVRIPKELYEQLHR